MGRPPAKADVPDARALGAAACERPARSWGLGLLWRRGGDKVLWRDLEPP